MVPFTLTAQSMNDSIMPVTRSHGETNVPVSKYCSTHLWNSVPTLPARFVFRSAREPHFSRHAASQGFGSACITVVTLGYHLPSMNVSVWGIYRYPKNI